MPANAVQWYDMQAYGSTPLGKALHRVTKLLENREQIPSRAYRPTNDRLQILNPFLE